MRLCRKCGGTFLESQFHKDRSRLDGLRTRCKSCDTASCREYRQSHRTKMRALRKAWYQKNKARVSKKNREQRVRNIASWMVNAAKQRAKAKGVAFDLNEHRRELKARAELGVCELTGIKLDPSARKAFNSPSLDRIDPTKGYIYSNVRIVCYGINCALGTWGEDTLRHMAKMLLKRRQ